MSNDEYVYYFHETNIDDPNQILDFINNGILSYRGNHMTSTMTPISKTSIEHYGLSNCLKRYQKL